MSLGMHRSPRIHSSVYVDPTARINGDVRIGADSSVWFHVSIRGDLLPIRVGSGTSVQDRCVLHTTAPDHACSIGDHVVLGHGAILHGCTVFGPALIGMGAILLDGCVIERDCVVAAGSVVPPGRRIERGHLALGSPAKTVRPLSRAEIRGLRVQWKGYLRTLREYRKANRFRTWREHPLREG